LLKEFPELAKALGRELEISKIAHTKDIFRNDLEEGMKRTKKKLIL